MSEYLHVETPFLNQLAALGWKVIDQGKAVFHPPSVEMYDLLTGSLPVRSLDRL